MARTMRSMPLSDSLECCKSVKGNAFVVRALEQREHRADARVGQALAGRMRRLHKVSSRFMTVVPMGHAADEGILVCLLRQVGEQFADLDAVHVGGYRFSEVAH